MTTNSKSERTTFFLEHRTRQIQSPGTPAYTLTHDPRITRLHLRFPPFSRLVVVALVPLCILEPVPIAIFCTYETIIPN